MKKYIIIGLSSIMLFATAACTNDANKEQGTENATAAYEEATEYPTIIPDIVDSNSEEAEAVKKAAKQMLDTFISADMDNIEKMLVDEDKKLFNFESKDQTEFYKAIFPKIKYEFKGVYEHDGVYGVMTTITSPDMADVFGDMWIELIDPESATAPGSDDEFKTNNLNSIIQRLNSTTDAVPERVRNLYIYVEYKNGNYIPRCYMDLANELIGGTAEVSSAILDAFK